jgi:hypothetical protein
MLPTALPNTSNAVVQTILADASADIDSGTRDVAGVTLCQRHGPQSANHQDLRHRQGVSGQLSGQLHHYDHYDQALVLWLFIRQLAQYEPGLVAMVWNAVMVTPLGNGVVGRDLFWGVSHYLTRRSFVSLSLLFSPFLCVSSLFFLPYSD